MGWRLKWLTLALALALISARLVGPAAARAQQQRDPLIDPPAGGNGSRFQVVGLSGWTAGETVTIRVGFTATDPLAFSGPFPFERQATVLRDGTWSFPVNVNDSLLGAPLGAQPGYLVVQAQSGARTATNAFVYTVEGARPVGADAIAPLGFGPGAPSPAFALAAALFAAGGGALLATSGALRRTLLA